MTAALQRSQETLAAEGTWLPPGLGQPRTGRCPHRRGPAAQAQSERRAGGGTSPPCYVAASAAHQAERPQTTRWLTAPSFNQAVPLAPERKIN